LVVAVTQELVDSMRNLRISSLLAQLENRSTPGQARPPLAQLESRPLAVTQESAPLLLDLFPLLTWVLRAVLERQGVTGSSRGDSKAEAA